MRDFNPGLSDIRRANDDKGDPAGIEDPGAVENLGWQTRAAAPSDAENALADALQAIFGAGIVELPQIVARLNRAGITPPDGAIAWTEAAFCAALRRLGT